MVLFRSKVTKQVSREEGKVCKVEVR